MKTQYKWYGNGGFAKWDDYNGTGTGHWHISTLRPQRLHKHFIWIIMDENDPEKRKYEAVMIHAFSLQQARNRIIENINDERKAMQYPEFRQNVETYILENDPDDIDEVLRDVPDYWGY